MAKDITPLSVLRYSGITCLWFNSSGDVMGFLIITLSVALLVAVMVIIRAVSKKHLIMPWKPHTLKKKYFKTKEIADELGLATSKILFWERYCPGLGPKKRVDRNNWKGYKHRRYTLKDRERIHYFHQLVEVEGFTLKTAKRKYQMKYNG